MNSSKKVILKFLISFSIIMLVPFFIFSNIMFKQIAKKELHNIASTYITGTHNIGIKLSNQISLFSDLKNIMLNESCFYNFNIKDNAGMYVYIEKELKKISNQKSSYYNTYFYSKETDRFYGLNTYLQNTYFQNTSISEQVQLKIKEAILSTSPKWIPMYKADIDGYKGYFSSYVLPFEIVYDQKDPEVLSSIVFNVSENAFIDIFESVTTNKDVSVLLKVENKPIYSNNPELFEYFNNSLSENLQKVDNYETSTINNKKYMIIRDTSNNNNIEIVTLILFKDIQKNLKNSLRNYFYLTVISLMFGCLLIVIFTKYNYTPISKLNKAIINSNLAIPSNNNFFEGISFAIQNLIIEKGVINEENLKYEKEKMLLKLISINSDICDSNTILNACREINIDFRFSNYICFIFEFDNLPEYNINCEDILSKLDIKFDLYSYKYEENRSIIFLACMDEANYETIDSIITFIISSSINPQDLPSLIGIGNFKDNTTLISNSYFEALQALHVCENHNSNMLFFKNISSNNTDLNVMFILKEIENFHKSIINIDIEKILICNNTIINSLMKAKNINICTMICLQLVYKCSEACEIVNIDISNTFSLVINQLSTQPFSNILEPIYIVEDVVKTIITMIKNQDIDYNFLILSQQQKPVNINEIINNINNNYLDPSFSIKNIASKFNTSVSNLSHMFKSKAGINISDYINTLKINTVKKMLVESDLSISQISEKVGYYHTSNFIKKFKKLEGITPNEYRTTNKQK